MAANPWYAWYASDARAKMAGLSLATRGAYRELLDHYYTIGGPIASDRDELYRIAVATTAEERAAVDTAVALFFKEKSGSLHNKRADSEIVKRAKWHEALSEAGRRGGLSRATSQDASQPQARPQPQPQPELHLQGTTSVAQPPNSTAVAYIPIIGGKEYGVSKELLAELEAAYPAVDGLATLKEIRAWCVTNPGKRKTERGVPRFINRWFEKVQNGG